MRVKLLSMTPNAKELIFASARQCYADGWTGDMWQEDETGLVTVMDLEKNEPSTDKEMDNLLKHLHTSGHTSVFEHVKFTFAVDGISRALSHQLVRHRIASYSQQSQRYVSNAGEFMLSDYVFPPSIVDNEKNEGNADAKALNIYVNILEEIQKAYNQLKALGIPSEDARYVMPNGVTTRIVITMNCVSLTHFLSLRLCTAAQWEIRNLAKEMLRICRLKLPCVFNKVDSRCEMLGYCPEAKSRCCGRKKVKAEALKSEGDKPMVNYDYSRYCDKCGGNAIMYEGKWICSNCGKEFTN
jgi:thymidylate synthase (FAD)